MSDKQAQGLLAQFDNPATLIHAAEKIRDAGYKEFDCHSPFPIHGMDDAMGEKKSKVSLIAGIGAIIGGGSMVALTYWVGEYGYPMVISGKPYFAYQAYFPVVFAIAVLLAAFGSLFGFMALMKLRFHHPVFYSDRFAKVTDDGFFVSIEAEDPQFDEDKTASFLKEIGGSNVEVLKES